MDHRPVIEVTLRYGAYRDQHKTFVIPIDEKLAEEMMSPVEHSKDAHTRLFTLMVGGPDTFVRQELALRLRRRTAKDLARLMEDAFMEAFGIRDELNGYNIEQMSPEEKAYHRSKGRL